MTTTKPAFDPTQPIHWILDWDGTITRRDTLEALVSIAASSKPDSPVLEEWKRVSEAYMTDYTHALAELAPEGKLPTTVNEEKKLLQALASVEQASLDRVSASKIFAGLTQKLLEEGASTVIESNKVEIRSGFDRFLKFSQAHSNDSLDLLSVNWSRHFISSCLSATRTPIKKASIYANELDSIDSNRISHGEIGSAGSAGRLIISSGDKLEVMAQLRNQNYESTNTSTHSNRPIVYVGDSWTDIECLLGADLGICIRDEPLGSSQKKLAERLESLDIHCPHLSAWRTVDEWRVVWAKDFTEIQTWVEGRNLQSA